MPMSRCWRRASRGSANSIICITTSTVRLMPTSREMAARIAAASVTTGIGLTLLPCLYTYGGFGKAAPNPGQVRFLNSTDRFLTLMARTREIAGDRAGSEFRHRAAFAARGRARAIARGGRGVSASAGAYPCRRADQGSRGLCGDARRTAGAMAARQCRVSTQRWCLIHATHMTDGRDAASARMPARWRACAR